ncbi:hypothetical protein KR52_06240 [Synechococcus sp. KORDI-52]|nr:hypothetical protein KR52_06240 [Synechococcus sp. KORDI-52]
MQKQPHILAKLLLLWILILSKVSRAMPERFICRKEIFRLMVMRHLRQMLILDRLDRVVQEVSLLHLLMSRMWLVLIFPSLIVERKQVRISLKQLVISMLTVTLTQRSMRKLSIQQGDRLHQQQPVCKRVF